MGQTTPNIGIYIPAAGETNYDQAFAAGMVNIDQHDHSGGPNKGLPIATNGLGAFSVTFDKLNANVVDPATGVGTSGTFPNQIVMLDPLKSIFQLAPADGFITMDGTIAHARTFQNSASVTWTNPDGVGGDPSASLISPVPVANGGTGVTSLTPYAPILGGTTSTGPVQQPAVGNAGDVLTSQGAGMPSVFASPGSLGQIQYVNFTLTAAQVRAIDTTSIQVLPAQGAGKVIVPIFAYGLLNSDGTPFASASGTNSIGFFYNDVALTMNFANTAFKTTTTNSYWWATQATSGTGAVKTDAQNTPFFIGMAGPITAYTGGGNSTITFTLAYTVITL